MRVFLLSLLVASSAFAEGNWVGHTLMPKEGAIYMNDNGELPHYKIPLPLIVTAEREDWLDVGPGRIRKTDVVLLSEAAAYYTAYLQRVQHPSGSTPAEALY